MTAHGVPFQATDAAGTVLYVAADGAFLGTIVIADTIKPTAARAIADLHAAGVKKTVMLTGDRTDVAASVAARLGIDEVHAELLPQDKVAEVEKLLAATERDTRGKGKLAFVATASTTRRCSPAPTSASPWAPWGRMPPSRPPTSCS